MALMLRDCYVTRRILDMRIGQAAKELNMTPRMLRYRAELGLLPAVKARKHRHFNEATLGVIVHQLTLEREFKISPAALAFALRAINDPYVAGRLRDLLDHLTATASGEVAGHRPHRGRQPPTRVPSSPVSTLTVTNMSGFLLLLVGGLLIAVQLSLSKTYAAQRASFTGPVACHVK
jgi:MerR family transcriptional regulator, copper efflux regulator